jgi:hypothetical protein
MTERSIELRVRWLAELEGFIPLISSFCPTSGGFSGIYPSDFLVLPTSGGFSGIYPSNILVLPTSGGF